MNTPITEKYFLFGLLIAVIAVVIAIFYPFLTMIILAAAFAVVLDPVYLWIKKHITRGIAWIASLLTVILFLLCLCVPIFFIGTVVFNETQGLYESISQGGGLGNASIQSTNSYINNLLPNGFTFDTEQKISELVGFVSSNITSFFTSTFNTIIMFTLMVLSIFYILKDGDHWKKSIVHVIPISRDNIEEIFSKLTAAINRILKGSFFIAIVQGLLTGIGFAVFNVPNPALWGVVAGMASFVPTIGTSLVSVPAMIYLFLNGMETQAIGLLVWSMILVGMVDNLLSPYVISKNTEIPSLFILFSILGGIALMGPVGILIGPLVLSLLYSLIAIYKKEAGLH
mgnify:CR=1 FL=1